MMTIHQYLEFVAAKIDEAEERGDKAEMVRLLGVLQHTIMDTIKKLQ